MVFGWSTNRTFLQDFSAPKPFLLAKMGVGDPPPERVAMTGPCGPALGPAPRTGSPDLPLRSLSPVPGPTPAEPAPAGTGPKDPPVRSPDRPPPDRPPPGPARPLKILQSGPRTGTRRTGLRPDRPAPVRSPHRPPPDRPTPGPAPSPDRPPPDWLPLGLAPKIPQSGPRTGPRRTGTLPDRRLRVPPVRSPDRHPPDRPPPRPARDPPVRSPDRAPPDRHPPGPAPARKEFLFLSP